MAEKIPAMASAVDVLASRWGIPAAELKQTVKAVCFRGDAHQATDAAMMAYLFVCAKYDLNPFLKQVHAFIDRFGAFQPIVGIDGWIALVNREKNFDGVELADVENEKGELVAVTCRMYVKGRKHPTQVTEYMEECYRDTEAWKRWKRRMLRHKAYIQCARLAFGFSGIVDEDEAERIMEAQGAEAGPALPLSIAEATASAEVATVVETEAAGQQAPADPPVEAATATLLTSAPAPVESPRQILWGLLTKGSKSGKEVVTNLKKLTGGKSGLSELSDHEVDDLIARLKPKAEVSA